MKLSRPFFKFLSLLGGLMIFIASAANAQTTGDYRSNAASFNWNTAASWQTYNGVSWVAAVTYPGQALGTGNVLVRSGQTVTINVSPANALGSLSINTGTLTFNVASSITLSVTGDVTVAAGTCTINVANAAGTNIHTLNIGGSLSVATGTTFDMTTAGDDHCNVIFNNAGNKTITVGSATSVAKFYDLTINKSTAATTVTSQTYPFIVNHDLIVSVGNLTLTASGSFYTVNNNLTVASGSTLTHNASYNSVSANTTYLQVNGDLSISGTYTYTGFTPTIWMNSGGVTATHNINTGTTALCELFLRTGNFYANGAVTINQDFYAMWNFVGGSFHTNGQTVNANWGLVNNGGTVYVDGGT